MSRTITTRLKMPTAEMLKRAERQRKAIIERHAKVAAAYEKALPKAAAELKRKMRAEAAALTLQTVKVQWGQIESKSIVKLPEKPGEKPDTWCIDRIIAMLKATAEETISVRGDSELGDLL